MDANLDLRKAFGLWGRPVNEGAWLLDAFAVVHGHRVDEIPEGIPPKDNGTGIARLMRYYGWTHGDIMDTPYPILRQVSDALPKLMAEDDLRAIANGRRNEEYVDALMHDAGMKKQYASLADYFAGIC